MYMAVVPSQSAARLSLQELNAKLHRCSSEDQAYRDHPDLLFDICTHSVIGDSNPRVVSAPGRILRSDVYAYTSKYNTVLEHLVDSHRIFEKLTEIMGIPDAALNEYEVQMNKWDDELKDFMLSAEKKCITFKNDDME